jgi:hypothetical protein
MPIQTADAARLQYTMALKSLVRQREVFRDRRRLFDPAANERLLSSSFEKLTNLAGQYSHSTNIQADWCATEAVDQLVLCVDFKNDQASDTSFAELLSATVDSYSLTSKKHFWSFLHELRTQAYPKHRKRKFTSFVDSIDLSSSWFRKNGIQRDELALLKAQLHARTRPTLWMHPARKVAASELQIKEIWNTVIEGLHAKEPPPDEFLKHLFDQLLNGVRDAVCRLTSLRMHGREVSNRGSTRDQVLSFVLRTGNPPPVGIVISAGSRTIDTKLRGNENETLRRRGGRGPISNRL